MTTPTLLHVDDDAGILRQSATVLARVGEDAGLVVETTGDPDAALDRLGAGDVACLVSDSLRTADGEPFVVAARRVSEDVPVVLFTGSSLADVSVEAAAEVAGYVRKGAGSVGRLEDVVRRLTATVDDEWTVLAVHDPSSGRELAVTLAEVLGSLAGTSPKNLPPLYAVVDTESLDAIVGSRANVRVEFGFEDLDVAVHGDGTISVRAAPDGRDSSSVRLR